MNAPTLRISFLVVAAGALLFLGNWPGGVPPIVSTAGAEPASPSVAREALGVSIAVPFQAGQRTILTSSAQDHFDVVVTNFSDRPVNVWEESNSWGYFALSFELTDKTGKTWTVNKKPAAFTVNGPGFETLEPHESLVREVKFADHDIWEDFPIPAEGRETFTMRAVFTVAESAESKRLSVWTGRIFSKADQYGFYHVTR